MVVILIFVALGIQIALCVKFANLAESKGYDALTYGLLCFFFSVVGYCMVAALPDLTLYGKIDALSRKLDKEHFSAYQTRPEPASTTTEAPKPIAVNESSLKPTTAEDGEIICPTCGKKQLPGRKVCWSCGQKFENEEKA